MILIFLIFALIIAFFAIVFAIQNNVPITINFLIWQLEGSLALVLLGALAVGAFIGWLVAVPTILKRGWKTAREKRKAEELAVQFGTKEKEVSRQAEILEVLQRSHQDFLAAVALHDPVTGVVHYNSLPKALAYLLRQMQIQSGNAHYHSLCVFLMSAEPVMSTDMALAQPKMNALMKAIAHRLLTHLPIDVWLFSDGHGKFACIPVGMDKRSASEFGNALQNALGYDPIRIGGDALISIESFVGGAIAHRSSQADHQRILAVANHALQHVQQRGRSRVHLLDVDDAVI